MGKNGNFCSDCKFFRFQKAWDINTENLEGEVFESYGISNPAEKTPEELEALREEHRIPHHDMNISAYCTPKIQMCQRKECFHRRHITPFMWTMARHQGQGQMNKDGKCQFYKPRKFLFINRALYYFRKGVQGARNWLKKRL